MAYDDILARSLLVLESRSLTQKITSSQLVDRYRSSEGFSEAAVHWLEEGLRLLMDAIPSLYTPIRLNKATALTWLVFASRVARHSSHPEARSYADFLCQFEMRRTKRGEADAGSSWSSKAMAVYDDRASARVGDVSSVVLRDFVLWLHFVEFVRNERKYAQYEPFGASEYSFSALNAAESGAGLETLVGRLEWGAQL
jgi:hypothetical protein